MPLYLAPMEDELDLVLIGAKALAIYSMYWCSRMVGHYQILVPMAFVPYIEMQDQGSKANY